MEHTPTHLKEFKPSEKKFVHISHLHFRTNPQTFFFFFYEEVVTMMILMKMRETAMIVTMM
jgi:hypothetical protein